MPANLIKPQTFYFATTGDAPNNPDLPVLLYRQALAGTTAGKANKFAAHFENHGWRGLWREGIFTYRHYHSNAHEVLGIAKGHVRLELGGETGKLFILKAGDLVVLPAGTAHFNRGASPDLLVIGAYPKGQEEYDICRDFKNPPRVLQRIAKVKRPQSDPFYGATGPLKNLW